jgi:hypothetical protein
MACSRKYKAHFTGGSRSVGSIKNVVIHSTEGRTAAGAAAWFQNPASKGSAHKVVDDKECYRTVPDDVIAYAAPPLNSEGLQLEIAGFAGWRRRDWLVARLVPGSGRRQVLRASLDKAARATAKWCHLYRLPPRFRGVRALRRGKEGVTFHRTVSAAFGQSDHSDPGLGFPKRQFMRHVRRHYRALA